jgi:hypothetical protein
MRQYSQVAEEGFEPPVPNGANFSAGGESGAGCGALAAWEATLDPELAAVAQAWATLPEVIRAGILAMIRAAS